MSYRVIYLNEAKQDIKEVVSYLASFYASTARDFKNKLTSNVNKLKDWPQMCPIYEPDSFFRRMVIDDYLLFYSVDEKRQRVVIHRIFHHARDTQRLLTSHRS